MTISLQVHWFWLEWENEESRPDSVGGYGPSHPHKPLCFLHLRGPEVCGAQEQVAGHQPRGQNVWRDLPVWTSEKSDQCEEKWGFLIHNTCHGSFFGFRGVNRGESEWIILLAMVQLCRLCYPCYLVVFPGMNHSNVYNIINANRCEWRFMEFFIGCKHTQCFYRRF